jgi:hypothetical protein
VSRPALVAAKEEAEILARLAALEAKVDLILAALSRLEGQAKPKPAPPAPATKSSAPGWQKTSRWATKW